jgi:hypothetical protein
VLKVEIFEPSNLNLFFTVIRRERERERESERVGGVRRDASGCG